MPNSEWKIPNDPDVDPENIEPGADLSESNLSEAELPGANLSEANLRSADLSNTNLSEAELSNAYLFDVDLSSALLQHADLSEADIRSADLSEAFLGYADLSSASLGGTTLSGSNLVRADLTSASLLDADLSKADLHNATLSDANFRNAILSDANLRKATFSDANLRNATLSGSDLTRSNLKNALLWDTLLSDILVSRNTDFSRPRKRLADFAKDEETDTPSNLADYWDVVARTNHELRTVYSDNGLLSKARNARVRERHARRKEALHDDTQRGTAAAIGSLISRWTTGYGVKLLPVVGVMLALFFGSTIVYSNTGMSVAESLYYSVVTFTTSPPNPPEPGLMRLVAAVETFLGTTMIVFLGYVLGAREQV
ncbi:pentapeptide repeat-containing protein [Halobacterium sp. KA-6]|uniref:pentapeptide repeat-containing protein n=1 Tax=Halobacterium sp. KA-6 TaxID=2896368 RepID=UPI001E2D1305|nr:pentapeptide repeat-containing protein [Halobacterium sp. KA-6]MCD2204025.1 pentapeptide repeat-containing protein [Halobacterium sp. KA-6]